MTDDEIRQAIADSITRLTYGGLIALVKDMTDCEVFGEFESSGEAAAKLYSWAENSVEDPSP